MNSVESFGALGLNLVNVPTVPLSPLVDRFQYSVVKRSIDASLAAVGLILLSPWFLVLAALTKLTSAGPVFDPWDVIGRGGRRFRGYKFRTMVVNADELKPQLLYNHEMTGPVFKMRDDPRITPLGRFLRKYSLDELPQLWSVLKGDMSLVGARPAGPLEWEHYEPWQRRKLSVTPGITCLWQVSGRNRVSNFDEWVRMDLDYIDHWSLWLDLRILLRTVPAVLRGTGM
ncbi:MAG: sugar transferase [Acidobacteriia bacterium]|nr:sugar transferase [Terriglobia bacterium]